MATTQNLYTGDGTTVLFPFSFPYIRVQDIKVSLDDVLTTEYSLANLTTIELNTPPAEGVAVRVFRDTADDALVATFYPGASIRAQDLNDDFEQLLYITQEVETFVDNADLEGPIDLANEAIAKAEQAIDTANDAEAKADQALAIAQQTDGLTISATPPPVAAEGTIWVNIGEDPPILFISNGTEWVESGGGASIESSATPPADPDSGALWFNTEDGRLYIWYVDADSSQWVDASPDSGALLPSDTAPEFPHNGDIWVDTSQCPPVVNVWSDCDGTGEWSPLQGGLAAPRIGNVTLGDGVGGGRFTGATFPVTVNMDEDGSPVSTKGLKIVLHEQSNQRALVHPTTTEITNVQTVDFADDFSVHPLNDNGWGIVLWAGPPFDCYVAFGGGSSNDNMAFSTDGQNWTRMQSTNNGVVFSPQNVAYQPDEQALFTVYASESMLVRRMSALDGVWVDEPYSAGLSQAGSTYGNALWLSDWNRWLVQNYAQSNNGPDAYTVLGAVGVTDFNQSGQWLRVNGGANSCGSPQYHQDGSITWTAGGWNNNGKAYRRKENGDQYTIMAFNSGVNSNHQRPNMRFCAVGNPVVGWLQTPYYNGTLNFRTGADIQASGVFGTGPNDFVEVPMGTLFPDQANGLYYDSLWIEDLGIAVVCGTVTLTTGETNYGCLWTTTNGTDWNRIITNAPGDTSEYVWYRMWWDEYRQELVLGASSGTNPGYRMGYSQTVGETIQTPQLTLASAGGLDDFGPGVAVEQSDGSATGVVARVDAATLTMTLKAVPDGQAWGPANAGLTVLGPAQNFAVSYADIDVDGNVKQLLQFDPGYRIMNGSGPYNITFPGTFESGGVPDEEILPGSSIRADFAAVSELSGFTARDEVQSNNITPT